MIEFVANALKIRRSRVVEHMGALGRSSGSILMIVALLGLSAVALSLIFGPLSLKTSGLTLLVPLSLVITVQSIFTLAGMLYAWEEPERVEKNSSPKSFLPPHYSFTAILPALHEERVIADTIEAVSAIDYPEEHKEILVVCRSDDAETIAAATRAIKRIGKTNIRLIIPDFIPKNKPEKLNFALREATKDVICVFDAEDSPHPDIYHIVNTVMGRDSADVVQSGVQLVNFRSTWFSALNVLEYFFWFKSVLHLFAEKQVIPLGGNTVFFKRLWLERIGGWDGNCLTEDADIGVALSVAGASIRIIYDETHATQEETPTTFADFVKQRTRWNQGFIQIYKKGIWRQLPTFSQRFLVSYILLWPQIQAVLFVYVLCSIIMMFQMKLPLLITMISLLPFYNLVMHFIVLNIGLYEFTKKFHLPYPWWMPLKLAVTFIPFQLGLGVGAIRALYRELLKNTAWEKTRHVNAHRSNLAHASLIAVKNQA